ncbi:altered inheritance of mitochondria protein 21 [Poronia punctata]|nr:altered inheritance of mitochondria protein 21 [Poronia punctata]
MSAATMSSAPAIPPRPSRSQEKDNANVPPIPARPKKQFNRSVSPNPDRFAPSPLNESPFHPRAKRNSQSFLGEELERSTSVDMPGVGEEGQEYAAAIEGLSSSPESTRRASTASPEQTRSVGADIKLHAPKPTVPATSAKQRVAMVTRTDSDRAAAFGIGRPSTNDDTGVRSLKKKASTTSQLSHHSEMHTDDEHGIPEIGQRVPMLSYAGDVQAPSPAPPRAASVDSTKSNRHHTRRTSSRNGFYDLPPGSYGLHGHGVESTDKLEKAYYEKHPDVYQKEHYHPLHDRVHDYSMSSENLNKIVRDTASRGVAFGTSGYAGTPSEEVGFQASDEYTSRISSPQPSTTGQKAESILSPLKKSFSGQEDEKKADVIHVDEAGENKAFAKPGDLEPSKDNDSYDDNGYPILAPDEVAKDPTPYELRPAVPPNRRGSEDARSRPSSRPASIYSPPPQELHSTPLPDVEEYEPLFPDDDKVDEKPKTQADRLREHRHRFPSQDIWEDAPNSVYSTAEVSTPEPPDTRPKSRAPSVDLSTRETETPAQAFARRQEELAEREALSADSFLNPQQRPQTWVDRQPHLAKEVHGRPNMAHRFPSRDIWEDAPDSLQFTTTVSHPQSADDAAAEDVVKSSAGASKPPVPSRPPKKQGSGDDGTSKPTIPDKPKPQVPARPTKSPVDPKETEGGAKQKPAVPARPVGGKIAALQAGFMSDLNNRLRLGPQAPKKEATTPEEAAEEKEKVPLADARKGRARGPQRRAPTKTQTPTAATEKSTPPPVSNGQSVLSFSMTRTLWSIDEEGTVTVDAFGHKEEQPGSASASAEVEVQAEAEEEAEPEEAEVEGSATEDTAVQEGEALETKAEAPSEQKEPEDREPEDKKEVEEPESESAENKVDENESSEAVEETKTLATNTAGESIIEETVEKKNNEGDEVKEVVETKDEVIS